MKKYTQQRFEKKFEPIRIPRREKSQQTNWYQNTYVSETLDAPFKPQQRKCPLRKCVLSEISCILRNSLKTPLTYANKIIPEYLSETSDIFYRPQHNKHQPQSMSFQK